MKNRYRGGSPDSRDHSEPEDTGTQRGGHQSAGEGPPVRRDIVSVFGVPEVRGEDTDALVLKLFKDKHGVARGVVCGVSEAFAQGRSLYRSVSRRQLTSSAYSRLVCQLSIPKCGVKQQEKT